MCDGTDSTRSIDWLLSSLHSKINFDDYVRLNNDISKAGVHPVHHFIKYGFSENRMISDKLNSAEFLEMNPCIYEQLNYLRNNQKESQIDYIFDYENGFNLTNPVRFIGYVEAKLGLGVVIRNTIECYRIYSEKFSIYPYNYGAEDRYEQKYLPEKYNTHQNHKINIFELGLDNIEHAWSVVNKSKNTKSYNILKIYWELSEVPSQKIIHLAKYDEIWVPSTFTYNAVRKVFHKNITLIPPFIDINCQLVYDRNHFNLEKGKFYFLFTFDYNSSLFRKNPVAVVKAFQAAFDKKNRSVGLIIKSNDPSNIPANLEIAMEIKHKDDRIIFIEQYLDRNEVLSLINCCDCYVSLHRSEGYGMGMAEAILMGKKVVATNYSGNVDFMNKFNSLPVEYEIVSLGDNHYYLGQGQIWADPSHESAVEKFRSVFYQKDSFLNKVCKFGLLYNKNIPSKGRISRIMRKRINCIMLESRF